METSAQCEQNHQHLQLELETKLAQMEKKLERELEMNAHREQGHHKRQSDLKDKLSQAEHKHEQLEQHLAHEHETKAMREHEIKKLLGELQQYRQSNTEIIMEDIDLESRVELLARTLGAKLEDAQRRLALKWQEVKALKKALHNKMESVPDEYTFAPDDYPQRIKHLEREIQKAHSDGEKYRADNVRFRTSIETQFQHKLERIQKDIAAKAKAQEEREMQFNLRIAELEEDKSELGVEVRRLKKQLGQDTWKNALVV